jgi:hypothetical protein
MNIIRVDTGAKLELLGGLIKAGGSLNFDMKSSADDAFEKQTFRYDLKSHTIQLRFHAKERINEGLIGKLMNGDVKATHVVSKIWIGAYIDASITYTHKFNSNSMKIDGNSIVRYNTIIIKLIFIKIGNLFGKFKKGLMDISGNISVGFNDISNNMNIENKVTIDSRP